jgi:hypothetical protein
MTPIQKVYYLKSILGNLQKFRRLAVTEPSIGGEVLADNINWLDCHIAALTAAAEVGRDARITKREYDDAMDDMRQKTIERCAQVAEDKKIWSRKEVAARIRALKDEP